MAKYITNQLNNKKQGFGVSLLNLGYIYFLNSGNVYFYTFDPLFWVVILNYYF